MDSFNETGVFLSKVLLSHDAAEMESLLLMLDDVGGKISDLKFQVKEMIYDTYVEFSKLPQEHSHMVTEARVVSKQVKELSDKIEIKIKHNLSSTTNELENLSAGLKEITLLMTIVNKWVELDVTFKSANKFQDEKKYIEMAKMLRRAQEHLNEFTTLKNEVEIFQALSQEFAEVGGNFLEDMMTVWGESLKFKEEMSIVNDEQVKCFSMLVNVHRNKDISQMFQALNYFDHLDLYFEKFASRILRSMVLPNILQNARVTAKDDGEFVMFTVEVNVALPKNSYEVVFKNLNQMFDFINTHVNIQIEENVSFINKLSEIISEKLIDLLIQNCLADAIPNDCNNLKYNMVMDATIKFQTYLKTIGSLKESDVSLEDYLKNEENLCAKKTCQGILEKARSLMKKCLCDTMEVGQALTEPVIKVDNNITIELKPSIELASNTIEFPRCQISKSVHEILTLINQVIVESTTATNIRAERLFNTARNIVLLYCAVVPTYHQEFLKTIPKQVALFYNNCMYLSHCLLTLGDSHRPLLPPVLQSHTTTFVDQVTELRSIGTGIFLEFVQLQRRKITDFIENSGLATLQKCSGLSHATEEAIRQCLRQLELLQTVWQNILPENVNCKAIGCLLNTLVGDLIGRVVIVEEIRVDTASNLVVLFKLIISRAPEVFPDPTAVHRFVSEWSKFLELVLILGASLKDISDRWDGGKGPTAELFQPEQLKRLIKALFKDTERRFTVLTRIK